MFAGISGDKKKLSVIDNTFFIWTESEKNLLEDLSKFHPNLKFTNEISTEKINYLNMITNLREMSVFKIVF